MKMKPMLRFVFLSIAILALSLDTSSYGTPNQVYAVQPFDTDDDQAIAQAGGWQTVSSPTTDLLLGVDIVSETDVWAVGSTDTLLRGEWRILHYTGGSWQVVDVSNPGGVNVNPLYSVAMSNPDNGWAVGRYTYMLHYENGSWIPQEEDMEPGGGPPEERHAIEMVSDTQGWVAGVHYDWDPQQGLVPSGLVREYMSASWDNRVDPETDKAFYDIAAVEATGGTGYELWGVGEAGTIYHFVPGGGWQPVDPSPTTVDLWSVAVISSTEAWAVGESGVILHHTGGTWQTVSSPVTDTLRAITMVSAGEGWAVGENGAILHYADGTWEVASSPTTGQLYDVDILPSGEGWIVGANGAILYHPMNPPTAAFTAVPTSGLAPLEIQFTDTSTGTITSRAWSFGDGATSTEQNPSHTYTRGGRYTCQLTVSNAGGSRTAWQTITVGNWGATTLAAGAEFTHTFTAAGYYPFSDPTTGAGGEVQVIKPGSLILRTSVSSVGTVSLTAQITVTAEGFTPRVVHVLENGTVYWVNASGKPRSVLGWGPFTSRIFLPLVLRST